jgi:hypothetical protein
VVTGPIGIIGIVAILFPQIRLVISFRKFIPRNGTEATQFAPCDTVLPRTGLPHGWSNCRENAEQLRIFLSGDIDIVPFDEEDAAAVGDLRGALETAGTPIGPYDLLIAARPCEAEPTLVTANVSEFTRVRGINWQDWTAEAP